MSSLVTIISAILSLLYNISRISRDIFSKINIFKRNRGIRKDYSDAEDAVKDGDIEKINDIIRNS